MERNYRIVDKAGLHARPASLLVAAANKFGEEINLVVNGKKINCKSIMGLMSAGISMGDEVTIEIDSDNTEAIFAALEEVIVNQNVVEVV